MVAAPGQAETLAALAGAPAWDVEEAAVASDVMLGEIAFDHPLFAPLAGAQFNDFTKIHFWKYRRIKPEALGAARVLARFENGDPAVVEKALGKGRLVVLTSGWNPADSQLARSSKFVPLMAGLLEVWNPRPFDAANHMVGDRVPLPAGEATRWQGPVVHKPDGTIVRLARGSTTFSETDQPGVYTDRPARPAARSFAVNLDPLESKTSPLHVETLEQFGCRLANQSQPGSWLDREQLRQMQNAELEDRQKLWRWLILAAIGVLIVETWLAGRVRQPRLGPRGGHDDMSNRTAAGPGTGRAPIPAGPALEWSGALLAGSGPLLGLGVYRALAAGRQRARCRAPGCVASVAGASRPRRSRCAILALRSVRDPRWVARRIEAKHPELGTGLLAAVEQDVRRARGPARVPADRRHP